MFIYSVRAGIYRGILNYISYSAIPYIHSSCNEELFAGVISGSVFHYNFMA